MKNNIPASANMEGMTLPTGWKVQQLLDRGESATGGHFSNAYVVDKDGRQGFMKAFDFSKSFIFASEAQAMHAFSEGRFEESLAAARTWISEEPFSSRAYLHATGAANLSELYDEAIKLATEGLRFDPKSIRLCNSLAFALGSSDQLDLAEEHLRDFAPGSDRFQALVAEANRGLVAMRRGELERGEQLYGKVIDGFRLADNPYMQNSALAYRAREAALANHPRAAEFCCQRQEQQFCRRPSADYCQGRELYEAARGEAVSQFVRLTWPSALIC